MVVASRNRNKYGPIPQAASDWPICNTLFFAANQAYSRLPAVTQTQVIHQNVSFFTTRTNCHVYLPVYEL